MVDLVFVMQEYQAGGKSLMHLGRWPWWSSGLPSVECAVLDGECFWRLTGLGPCGAVACHCQVTASHGLSLSVYGVNCEYHGSKGYMRDVFGSYRGLKVYGEGVTRHFGHLLSLDIEY